MVSFAVQKFLSLIRSHLFIFVFTFITLGGGSEKILLRFISESVQPISSSKRFFFFFLVFLGPHLRHMEVPRLGLGAIATAMPDPSHIHYLCHSLQQHPILNPLSEAKD